MSRPPPRSAGARWEETEEPPVVVRVDSVFSNRMFLSDPLPSSNQYSVDFVVLSVFRL